MVKPICDLLDRLEGRESKIRDDGCKNWSFPHLDRACVLSSVFSVRKGEPCFQYEPIEEEVK
jgi:hypothetical protein